MKKRILIIGDSARVNTGYGVVIRNIGNTLALNENFEVRQLGIFEQVGLSNAKAEDVNFKIYSPRYNIMYDDRLGEKTFEDILKEYCPHVIITIGDPWHLYYVNFTKIRDKFTWISYVPVDGEPYPRVMPYNGKWFRLADITNKPDYIIAFNKFGKDVLEKAGVNVHDIINHGVDIDTYRPLSNKIVFKKEFFLNVKNIDNATIFGFIGRNQFRKNIPSILKAWKIFHEKYSENANNSYLYLHVPNNDTKGHNLPEVIKDLELKQGSVILPDRFTAGVGLSEINLNKLYNSFDCLISGTMGEGWSLSFLESMAAGTPIIVPNYSGQLEFANKAAWLIDIKDYIIEIISGINRAIIDEGHLAELMNKFVCLTNEERKKFSNDCIERAKDFQWINVNKKWIDLIESIDVSDYKFTKEDFKLRPQDEIFVNNNGEYKIIANPIDINVSPKTYPKVGYVSTYNEKCGIATYTSNLKNAIENVSGEKNGVIFSELTDYAILFKQVVSSNINVLHWQHEPGIIDYGNVIMKFLLDMKKVRPDIKNVFTLHAEHPTIKQNIDSLADAVILHSDKSDFIFNSAKAYHINHPLPKYNFSDEIRNEYREKLGVKDKFVVGFNGFMVPSKALDQILKYFADFIKENRKYVFYFLNSYPENAKAREQAEVIYGSLCDIVKEFNLEDNVIIDNEFYSKEEMSKRIQTFDIGVCYMGGETLSQSGSIAEVVANGVPVIASNVNHFKHMINNGFCIPVYDEGNISNFVDKIKSFLISKTLDKVIYDIRNQISKTIGNLSYEVFAKKHLDIYSNL